MTVTIKQSDEIRTERLREPRPLHDLVFACMWIKNGVNLGTLARTADALGGCLAIQPGKKSINALKYGNTIGLHNTCVHWIEPRGFDHFLSNCSVVSVELAHGSIPLSDVEPATEPTTIVIGHEVGGVPPEVLAASDLVVEIPMVGVGNSLNVAVAGSLVGYKLRGWS